MKHYIWHRTWVFFWTGLLWVSLTGCPNRPSVKSNTPPPTSTTARPKNRTVPPARRVSVTPTRQVVRTPRRHYKRHRTSRFVYVSAHAYRFYLQGRLLAEQSKHKKAIHSFKSALVYNPTSPYLHYCIARQYRYLKKWESAFFWAKKMQSIQQSDGNADHLLGQLHAIRGQWTKAVVHFQSAIKKSPKMLAPYEALEKRWRSSYQHRNKLRDLLQRLIKQIPENHIGYLRLGQLYERLVQDKLALTFYKKTLNRHPSDITALAQMAGIYFRQKSWKQTIRIYRLLLDYRPDAWQVRLLLGSTFLLRGRKHDNALAQFQFRYVMKEVTHLKPADRAFRIGWELHSRGYLKASIVWLKRSIRLDTHHNQARLSLGVVFQILNNHKEAFRWYRSIPKKYKAFYVEAQARIIDLLLSIGKSKEARDVLNKARSPITTTELWIRLSQGFVERASKPELKREAKAIRSLLKKEPKSYQLSFQLAYTVFKLRRYRKVEMLLKKVLSQKKDHSAAFNFLGYVYAVRGVRLVKAEVLVRKALSLEPGNAYYLDSLGWVLFQRGKVKRAHQLILQAHHMLPNEAAVTFHFGRVVERLGNHREAIRLYQKSLALSPPPDVVRKLKPRLQRLQRKR